MATPGFELLFDNLQQVGFFEFVLPLILFMAIFYGVIRKTGILGDDEGVQGVAAIALAFMTTFGIYVFVPFSFFPQFFGALSVLIVLILGVMILAGMAGFDLSEEVEGKTQRYATAGAILIALIMFPPLFGMFGTKLEFPQQYTSFLLTLIMIVGVVYVLRGLSGGGQHLLHRLLHPADPAL
ncbi:MAG: hypothetical protein ABEK12_01795 [Candidatus Nanohaloarchaea archaeon]